MSSCNAAVLQSGPLLLGDGDGDGAGVGGDAGAEGSVLPGITFGFEGIGIGMDDDGVTGIGRECMGENICVEDDTLCCKGAVSSVSYPIGIDTGRCC